MTPIECDQFNLDVETFSPDVPDLKIVLGLIQQSVIPSVPHKTVTVMDGIETGNGKWETKPGPGLQREMTDFCIGTAAELKHIHIETRDGTEIGWIQCIPESE